MAALPSRRWRGSSNSRQPPRRTKRAWAATCGQGLLQSAAAVDKRELWLAQAALDEIIENRAPSLTVSPMFLTNGSPDGGGSEFATAGNFRRPDRGSQVRSGLVWGFSCQAVVLGCADSFLFGAGKAVFRPVACNQVRGARGRGQGTETLAELGRLPPSVACVSQRLDA